MLWTYSQGNTPPLFKVWDGVRVIQQQEIQVYFEASHAKENCWTSSMLQIVCPSSVDKNKLNLIYANFQVNFVKMS